MEPDLKLATEPVRDSGKLPDHGALAELGARFAESPRLSGPTAAWVYATSRAQALAWSARVGEWWVQIRPALQAPLESLTLRVQPLEPPGDIACLWADSIGLSDDGAGWTRAVPSTVRTLVIVTHGDIPALCRIYERVVATHRAAGVLVITFCPGDGKILVYGPRANAIPAEPGWAVNVLAVPRLRRNCATPNRMFLAGADRAADLEVLAALRLDPRDRVVPKGMVHVLDDDATYRATDEVVDAAWLLRHSVTRTRVEGLARSTAAMWRRRLSRLVHQRFWTGGVVPNQLVVIEKLLDSAWAASESPYWRRWFLEDLLGDSDEQGTLLPNWLLDDLDAQVEAFGKTIRETLAEKP